MADEAKLKAALAAVLVELDRCREEYLDDDADAAVAQARDALDLPPETADTEPVVPMKEWDVTATIVVRLPVTARPDDDDFVDRLQAGFGREMATRYANGEGFDVEYDDPGEY